MRRRRLSHDRTARTAKSVDQAVWKAFGTFAQFEEGFESSDEYADAHMQFRMPLPEGGFRVALYAGMFAGFAFASTVPALCDTLRSQPFKSSSLFREYDADREALITAGAVSAEDAQHASQAGDYQDDTQDDDTKRVVLPLFDRLVADPLTLDPSDLLKTLHTHSAFPNSARSQGSSTKPHKAFAAVTCLTLGGRA